MFVSYEGSKVVYGGIRAAGIRSISALPETWLIHLLEHAESDPEMQLIEVAREEEVVGVAAGAYFTGEPHLIVYAESRLLRGHQRGRVASTALLHPPVQAGRLPRTLGRALPLAHPWRHRDRGGAEGARYPLRALRWEVCEVATGFMCRPREAPHIQTP